ncbi:MAG: ATP synthase subunit I [Pseudomonadota bacterium]
MQRHSGVTKHGARIARPPVYRITLFQLLVLALVVLALAGWDSTLAQSFAAGGLVSVIPQLWFARGVFRWRGAQMAQRSLSSGYAAEAGKYLLTAAGFALVFAMLRPISGGAVFTGFVVMLAIQLAGAWWLLRRRATSPGLDIHDTAQK